MSRKDFFHDTVKRALIKDGWTITHDPIRLQFFDRQLKIDLGAERVELTKGLVKIAVEVKNFRARKDYANELHKTVGQLNNYRTVLRVYKQDYITYLAISQEAFNDVFTDPLVVEIVRENRIKIVVFCSTTETILKWDAQI